MLLGLRFYSYKHRVKYAGVKIAVSSPTSIVQFIYTMPSSRFMPSSGTLGVLQQGRQGMSIYTTPLSAYARTCEIIC